MRLTFGALFSSVVIMLVLSCSSNSGDTSRSVYRYNNESSADIDITRYWTGEERLFTIAAGASLEVVELVGASGDVTNVLYLADSLKVTFNNARSLLHRPSDTRSINILRLNNYSLTNEGDDRLYEYTFTQVDFDAAD